MELHNISVSSWKRIEIFILLVVLTARTASEECAKINPCRCQFRNGSVLDLESLGTQGTARWQEVKSQTISNFTYYYNPCYDFKLPEHAPVGPTSQCATGVAACKVSEGSSPSYFTLGSQESAEFQWNQQSQRVHLIYYTCTHERSANITLICNADPLGKDTFVVERSTSTQGFESIEMSLISRCACPNLCGHKDLSAGSILIILFSVFVILYLLFGMIFNKLTRGAQGWELIPNYEFWQDFPLLVRDGCVYVASGCKPDTTYERI